MTAQYVLSTGEVLHFTPGIPRGFFGALLHGVETYSTKLPFATIVIQEYNSDFISFRNVHITWKDAGRFICYYDYPPSLFSRATIDNDLLECVKGAGLLHMMNEQFALLTGSKWVGLIDSEKPGNHHYVDIAWSAEIFQNLHIEYPQFFELLQNITDGLPDRVKGPFHQLDTYMQRILTDIFQLDFSKHNVAEFFEELLERYLNMLLREVNECKGIIKNIGEDDWHKVVKAQTIIEDGGGLTIPQISRMVGMSDYKLKKLFPAATGFSVDEYRKYWLCVKAAKKIVQRPDLPLKNFYSEAGYTSESTFIRGFKKLCFCTPGELRRDSWDVKV